MGGLGSWPNPMPWGWGAAYPPPPPAAMAAAALFGSAQGAGVLPVAVPLGASGGGSAGAAVREAKVVGVVSACSAADRR